jgi:hypothetical protein
MRLSPNTGAPWLLKVGARRTEFQRVKDGFSNPEFIEH